VKLHEVLLAFRIGAEHLVAVENTVVAQVIVLDGGVGGPVAVAFGDEAQRRADFELRGEDRQAGAAGCAVEALVEILADDVDKRGQRDGERDALKFVSRSDADRKVVAFVRGQRIEDDRRFIAEFLSLLHVGIHREAPKAGVVVSQLEAEIVRRLIGVGLALEGRPKDVERHRLGEFHREPANRIDLVPMAGIHAGFPRVNAVPDAGGDRHVVDECLLIVIQVPENEEQRLEDDSLVFDIEPAGRDVGIGDVEIEQDMHAARLGLRSQDGFLEFFLGRWARDCRPGRGGQQAGGEQGADETQAWMW